MSEAMPQVIPVDGNHFPEKALETLVGSRIVAITHQSMGAIKIDLADGRSGTYQRSSNPQRRGWILER